MRHVCADGTAIHHAHIIWPTAASGVAAARQSICRPVLAMTSVGSHAQLALGSTRSPCISSTSRDLYAVSGVTALHICMSSPKIRLISACSFFPRELFLRGLLVMRWLVVCGRSRLASFFLRLREGLLKCFLLDLVGDTVR